MLCSLPDGFLYVYVKTTEKSKRVTLQQSCRPIVLMGAVYCAGQGKVRFLQIARSAAVEFHLSPAEPSGHLETCRKETR